MFTKILFIIFFLTSLQNLAQTIELKKWKNTASGVYISEKPFILEKEANYTFSGKVMFVNEDNDKKHFILPGFKGFDSKKRYIAARNSQICGAFIFSKLLKDAKENDNFVIIPNDGKDWSKAKNKVLAFNIKRDYSDLPNFDVSPVISSVEKTKDGFKIFFANGLKHSYPAGTQLRAHYLGGYQYAKLINYDGDQIDEWLDFSVTVAGKHFRAGTINFFPIIIARGYIGPNSFKFKEMKLIISK